MKRIFFVLMAVTAIAMTGSFTGCDEDVEPFPLGNERRDPTKIGDTTPQYIEGLKFNAPMVILEAE